MKTLLIILISLLLFGCATTRRKEAKEFQERTKGWEYVRIERQVPDKNCAYIVQEVCGEKGLTKCLNWYKRRAKNYGANTVVIIEDVRSRTATYGDISPAKPTFKSSVNSDLLADYYNCPKCEPIKEREK
jgi:hypothetical protein